MAWLGISLVLASAVYLAIRRPPLIETLIAIFRGHPQIEQPPSTRKPSPPPSRNRDQSPSPGQSTSVSTSGATTTKRREKDANATAELPSLVVPTINPPSEEDDTLDSPQTTPKAVAATDASGGGIPSFSLTPDPPASAAAVARASASSSATLSSSSTTPFLLTTPVGATTLASTTPPKMSMPPPPPPPSSASRAQPPRLNGLSSSTTSRPIPNGRQPPSTATHAAQPGSSTLAPPPTHSSKPSKPSKKVTLEPGHSPLDWARLSSNPNADLRNLPAEYGGPGAGYIRVTPSMLKKMTGRRGKDAWTALGGRVYNITPYLPFHPGGEPELLRAAGRDGTQLFAEIHSWVNYETMLSGCLIGLLVDENEAVSKGEMDAMD